MPKGVSDKVTFNPYEVGQGELIPPTADELIPANHLARIVNSTLNKLDPVYGDGTKAGASCEWGLLMIAYNLRNRAIAPG